MTLQAWTRNDEETLRYELSIILPKVLRRTERVTNILRETSDQSSWYGSDIVTVHLDSGYEMKTFLKNFGSSAGHQARHGWISATATVNRSDLPERRVRELGVYRHLIGDSGLGTPAYYGHVWNPDREHFWLLLEFVSGASLKDFDTNLWVASAGWLGRLQGHFVRRSEKLLEAAYLVRYDAAHYEARAEYALQAVARIAPHETERTERLIARYTETIGRMTQLPLTLVHGNYIAPNIIIDQDTHGLRICPVDWEEAGLGSPLYDLAFISHGFKPPILDEMCRLYRQEAEAVGMCLPDPETMNKVIEAFWLHRVVRYLSRSVEKRFTADAIVRLLEKGEFLCALTR